MACTCQNGEGSLCRRKYQAFKFYHLWQIEDSSSFDDDPAEEEEGEGDEKEGGNLAAILFSLENCRSKDLDLQFVQKDRTGGQMSL